MQLCHAERMASQRSDNILFRNRILSSTGYKFAARKKIMEQIVQKALETSMSYSQYREMIDSLLEEGKTTGPDHSEDFLHYTKMNITRMKRLDKTTQIGDDMSKAIKGLGKKQVWLVITEAWCGDAAQVAPVIEAMAALNSAIETRYVLRDEHTELIDRYLTNGGRSIPKILLLDSEAQDVYTTWGPRPSELQAIIDANKASDNPKPYSEMSVDVQRWYAKNKTVSIQKEFGSILC